MKNMTNKKKLYIMVFIVFIIILVAIFGKYMAPHDPFKTDLANSLRNPCKEYIFGTDKMGRCIACRILAGASSSIFSALTVVGIVFVVGTLLGVISGFFGGIYDKVLMKITLVFQAFPSFILAVTVAGTLGVGIRNSIISLVLVYWTTYARLSRSMVLNMKESTYIRAAKMCGASKFHIIFKYIIPNLIGPLIVTAMLDIGNVILSMAGLSYLGLGAAKPSAEWGSMMCEAKQTMQQTPWGLVFPGLAIFIVVIAFNMLGDKIRDTIDEQAV